VRTTELSVYFGCSSTFVLRSGLTKTRMTANTPGFVGTLCHHCVLYPEIACVQKSFLGFVRHSRLERGLHLNTLANSLPFAASFVKCTLKCEPVGGNSPPAPSAPSRATPSPSCAFSALQLLSLHMPPSLRLPLQLVIEAFQHSTCLGKH
jgi:hypothetical protein